MLCTREVDATRGSRTPLQAAPKPSRLRAAAGPGETDQSARGTPGLQLLRCPPRDWRSVSPYNQASRMQPRTLATNAESIRCRRSIRRVHSREGERQLPRRRTSACAQQESSRPPRPGECFATISITRSPSTRCRSPSEAVTTSTSPGRLRAAGLGQTRPPYRPTTWPAVVHADSEGRPRSATY